LLAVQRNFDLVTGDRARQAEIANQSQRFGIDLLGKNTLEVMKAIEARRVQLALDERIFQLRKADPGADTSQAIAQAAVETANSQALITEAYNKQRDAVFGADEAIRKYQEDAGNKGAQIEAALSSAFKGAEDALVQFATTGKLSFKGLADSIVADISRILIKQQLAKGLASIGSAFGEGGGGFGSLLAGVFGGGKASGGAVSAGGLYEVGEQGPEVLTSGGRQYLLMGAENGTVTPNGGGGGGVNQTINFVNNGPVDRRTQDQVAARAAQGAQRAMARNS
jgi:lambda family phage tail tape measure protein